MCRILICIIFKKENIKFFAHSISNKFKLLIAILLFNPDTYILT